MDNELDHLCLAVCGDPVHEGSEPYSSERKTGLYTVLFTVRWDSLTKAVTPKMRISYDSRIYDIRQVTERTDEFRKMYVTIEGEYKDLT